MASSSSSSIVVNNQPPQLPLILLDLPQSETFTDVGAWPQGRKFNELLTAASSGNWDTAKEILDTLPTSSSDHETEQQILGVHYDMAVLSIGVGKKALGFVEQLIMYLPESSLQKTDKQGVTVLHAAATLGNIKAAFLLVDRMSDLIYAVDNYGNYPVHRAAQNSHREVLEYLMGVTKWDRNGKINEQDSEERGKVLLLLIRAMQARYFDIALDLVRDYPFVATTKDGKKNTALHCLAGITSEFLTSYFNEWKMLWTYLLMPMVFFIIYASRRFIFGKESPISLSMQVEELTRRLCTEMKSLNPKESEDIYKDAILKAAERGNDEVVELILKAFPKAICVQSDYGQSILHLAIENRNKSVFHAICGPGHYKHIDLGMRDEEGNNILHLVAKLPPRGILDKVTSPALQMQMEVQWYEGVNKVVTPDCALEENNKGQTPRMMFDEEHSELMRQAEEWIKQTANSCCIVAVLIVTVMFGAAITVPGGTDDTTGFPIFKSDAAFTVFVVSDAISLLTSTFSLMIFLSANTEFHSRSDFKYWEVTRLTIGFINLLISITFMMVACTITIYLVLGRKALGALIPVSIISALAVTWFLKHQLYVLCEWIITNYIG